MLWLWITVPTVLIVLSAIAIYLYLQRKNREKPDDEYPRIEDQIQGSSMAPTKFKLKELRKATVGCHIILETKSPIHIILGPKSPIHCIFRPNAFKRSNCLYISPPISRVAYIKASPLYCKGRANDE
jgi:hypothetical protein